MHAKLTVFVLPALDRPVVQQPLLPALGLLPFLAFKSLQHAAERLETLTFCHPSTPLNLELLFAIANDLLLRAHGAVQSRKKVLIIFPVHGADVGG